MEIIKITMQQLILLLLFFSLSFADVWMGNLKLYDAEVWPEGRAGNYGTVKYFLDEDKGEQVNLKVSVEVYSEGAPPDRVEVEAYTNLNRRDFTKIFESINEANQPDSYWVTKPMQLAKKSGNNYVYRTEFAVNKTGVYRLTTRFRINHGPWQWSRQFDGQRDAAIVVSPRKVLGLTLYEVNPLVIEAFPGNIQQNRSTFEDFTDHENDTFDPFNLSKLRKGMGFNTLWIMPIMPVTKERYNPELNRWVRNESPGSPYATRNYYAINGNLVSSGDELEAKREFQYLVQQADELDLNIFIDMAFNHSGRDVCFGRGGVELGFSRSASALIRYERPAWATSKRNYREHASSMSDLALFAPAERLGEHRWYDAGFDWYFGDYSALGPKSYIGDVSRGGAQDERDLMYTDLNPAGGYDSEVVNVWNYFAYVLPYWLKWTNNGLDGIRADFAQGLPSQAWEYIINKTRQVKWDFVFFAEVLDPDQVLYRTNRLFDVITTVDHYLYRSDTTSMSVLAASLEKEAGMFGYNAAVLHNGTSHDEQGNGNPWLMAARYAVTTASYGVPMVFMSQPLGIPYKIDFQSSWQNIKEWWDKENPKLVAFYKRLNEVRAAHPALRSTKRIFLRKKNGTGFNDDIFSVARWDENEVILVFINLRNHMVNAETFVVPPNLPLHGQYQAVNLVADDPDAPLWPQPQSADALRENGIFVQFRYPNEVQYLALRKVD
ncbi:MAG: alpha-amylase family glycosyl hydrolase [Candidatus Electrothrix aestuarii]|uniref:Alpha-amylase family glycosyl hydrolase n=1 Tax=Candidatus Electrothrix aestuarii TaxID=3062594 RepID=A0AAU8LUH8_9BACT|nr:alpha-amylase family glycosyl hydrolase [Candidatus Electrothrix aestuarii]